ncbi:MAG: hypothetical protein ACO3GP_02450 [Candidatus Limnocylindrus sp.]
MPGKRDEALWARAKAAVSKSRKKGEGAFTDLDWGLVQRIYKSMGGT